MSTCVHQALVLHIVDFDVPVAALAPLLAERSGWSVLPILDQMAGSSLDALTEAILVHLRLLDDFLGGPMRADDVAASDLAESWVAQHFLDAPDRELIDAQLDRLIGRQDRLIPWPISTLTLAMVASFERFLDAVPPDRWSLLAGADIACQLARAALSDGE